MDRPPICGRSIFPETRAVHSLLSPWKIGFMVDVFEPSKRSRIMSSIKSKHTKPELAVRKLLHGMGYRFTLHAKELPGKPDIYFSKRRRAIQIQGCFWHGHAGCSRSVLPSTNRVFWQEKIGKNKTRDRKNAAAIAKLGIKSLTLWQCEIRDLAKLSKRLHKFLGAPRLVEKEKPGSP